MKPRKKKNNTKKQDAKRKKYRRRDFRRRESRRRVTPPNAECQIFQDEYVNGVESVRTSLADAIKNCQQKQSKTLLDNLVTDENVEFYWDVDNLQTMSRVINGVGDYHFNNTKDSFPLPESTKWFRGTIDSISREHQHDRVFDWDGEAYLIKIFVNEGRRIELHRNNFYRYYNGYLYDLDSRYIKERLTWSIDFSQLESYGIVTLCINPTHIMANSHWYGLPWVNGIWERSLPIRKLGR